MTPTQQVLLQAAVIFTAMFIIYWVLDKVFGWLFKMAYVGPLWARILLWPYKMIVLLLAALAGAHLAREAYRWMNNPRD